MSTFKDGHDFSLCQRGNPHEKKILVGGGGVAQEDYLIDNDRNL